MDTENLIKLINAVSASELTGFRYEEDGVRLHLTKKQTVIEGIPAAAGDALAGAVYGNAEHASQGGQPIQGASRESGKLVVSPLVGIFYSAPSEDAQPFVTVGSRVEKGQTLAIVEAMKLMNDIESDYDGVVMEILAENGQTVEYGQPLFRIG